MIAVLGGSGFLGKHVVRALKERRVGFTLLDRRELRSPDEIRRALRGATQVLHLAGRINGSPQALKEANPGLMRRLTEAVKQSEVRRILYVSSAAAQFQKGPYGRSKGEAEEVLRASGIPHLIFRPTLLYGEGDTKNIATLEKVIQRSPWIPLLGGGIFLIQPLYVEDAVNALIQALESPLKNRVYNLAGPRQISLKEMIESVAETLGKRPRLISVPLKPVQVLAKSWSFFFPNTRLPVKQILELDQHRAFDIEDAKTDLGFRPRPFREGIRAMKARGPVCAG